jgi:outer membrane PBP1 activator LpoA protein
MTPSQIITQEAQKVGYDADVMLRKINKLVQGKAATLIQKNDSLLLLISIAKGVDEVHLFTVDSPAKIAESLRYFVKQVKQSGIKTLYGPAGGKQSEELKKTLALLDKLGLNVQKSNMPRYSWMAEVK